LSKMKGALILSMQNDPDMQTLLNGPAIIRTIKSGDFGTPINIADFMNFSPTYEKLKKSGTMKLFPKTTG